MKGSNHNAGIPATIFLEGRVSNENKKMIQVYAMGKPLLDWYQTDVSNTMFVTHIQRITGIPEQYREFLLEHLVRQLPFSNFSIFFSLIRFVRGAEAGLLEIPKNPKQPVELLFNQVIPLQRFTDSPDAGMLSCLCSRCGKIIKQEEEEGPPIRLWPGTDGKQEVEFRFHHKCYTPHLDQINWQILNNIGIKSIILQ